MGGLFDQGWGGVAEIRLDGGHGGAPLFRFYGCVGGGKCVEGALLNGVDDFLSLVVLQKIHVEYLFWVQFLMQFKEHSRQKKEDTAIN